MEETLQNTKDTNEEPFQLFPNPFGGQRKIKAAPNRFIEKERKKIILTYGEVLGHQYWWDTPFDFDFYERDGTPCEYRHCKLVYDAHNYVRIADAVLFHGQDLPSTKELKGLKDIPVRQIWIWMTSESPAGFSNLNSLASYRHVFNWTGTYRLDSDIWTPYFVVKPLPSQNRKELSPVNYARGKKKMVIAIISNNCQSYRTKFIKKLREYIQVDVYGKCKEEFDPNLPECAFGSDECKALQSQYKFSLSLESAHCKDYITEKFYYNGLIVGNVPVVMNRADMSNPKVAPPDSFINILDFMDAESLANYLKMVASSDDFYNKFHAWRQNYKVGTKNRMCTTCEALWKRDLQPEVTKHKAFDVREFWNYKKNCISYENEMFQNYLK